jgi:hypothetical protein
VAGSYAVTVGIVHPDPKKTTNRHDAKIAKGAMVRFLDGRRRAGFLPL